MAKKLTLIIIVLAFIIGCIGAFVAQFNMTGYIDFIKGFGVLYIPIILSIGANSAVEKIKPKKE